MFTAAGGVGGIDSKQSKVPVIIVIKEPLNSALWCVLIEEGLSFIKVWYTQKILIRDQNKHYIPQDVSFTMFCQVRE